MQQAPEIRYGQRGHLDYDEVSDTLLCHVCGKAVRNLAGHARLVHGLDAAAYREMAGLNRQTRLISRGMSDRLREVTAPLIARLRAEGKLKRWDEDPERWREAKAAAVEVVREGLRSEGSQHRRAAIDEERRQKMAERTRERNLSGELRASPEVLSAAAKRYYAEHPEAAAAGMERMRGIKPYRDYSRDVVCPRCEQPFRAASHREKYCPACRPDMVKVYSQQHYERRQRRHDKARDEIEQDAGLPEPPPRAK